MANDKITLLRHFQLLAVRSAAFVTSKVSELATSVTEALEELEASKQDKINSPADIGAAASNHTHDDYVTSDAVQSAVGLHDGDSWAHQDIRLEVENARTTASGKMAKDFSNATATLPVSNGGTGVTTLDDLKAALGLDDGNYAPAYQYGTEDLTAGSSALASGTLYFVYE